MNSKATILITSILAFALLANLNNVGSVFATGNLDDEEEEEAIESIQSQIQELQGTLGTLTLNLTEGSNSINANCPSTEEIVQEVIENITAPVVEENVTEPQQPAECPVVQPEPEEPAPIPNQTVIPEPEEPQQNITEGCEPVPEPVVEENETQSVLEPIICPVNGEILGYTNTTSGEQLPISAVNETIPFLPPIELPTEPEQNQTVVPPEEPQQNITGCNNVTETEQPVQEEQPPSTVVPENNQTVQDEQPIATIEFEATCGCFVVDKTPEDVESNGGGEVGIGNPEEIEQGLYY